MPAGWQVTSTPDNNSQSAIVSDAGPALRKVPVLDAVSST